MATITEDTPSADFLQVASKEHSMMLIAQALKDAMATKGWSAEDLATASGVTSATIRNILKQRNAISASTAVKIQTAFGGAENIGPVWTPNVQVIVKASAEELVDRIANQPRTKDGKVEKKQGFVGSGPDSPPAWSSISIKDLPTQPRVEMPPPATEVRIAPLSNKFSFLDILGPKLAERAINIGLPNLLRECQEDLSRVERAMQVWQEGHA